MQPLLEADYLQVAVNDVLGVQVMYGAEDLVDEAGGVLFGVVLDFDDAVKQLAASNTKCKGQPVAGSIPKKKRVS